MPVTSKTATPAQRAWLEQVALSSRKANAID